jgi:hypothetical protein
MASSSRSSGSDDATPSSNSSSSSSSGGGGSSPLTQPHLSWSLSRAECEALWAATLQLLPEATSQDLALLVWGYSSLVDTGVVPVKLPVKLVKAVLRASYLRLSASTATDLACLLMGWSKLQVAPGRQYMDACCSVWVGRLAAGAGPQEQVNVLTAVAALGHRPPHHVLVCYCRYSQQLLGQYSPQGLAAALDALSKLGFRPPAGWQRRFWAAAEQQMGGFHPRDCVQLLYAAAALELAPPTRCIDALLVNLRSFLVKLPPKALTGVIWALGTLRHRPGVGWMQVFFDQVNVLTAGGPEGLPEVSAGFGSIVLHGVTLWAAKQLGYAVAEEGEELQAASGSALHHHHHQQQQEQEEQEQIVPGWQQGQELPPPATHAAMQKVGRVLQAAGAAGSAQPTAVAAAAGSWGLAEGEHETYSQPQNQQQQQQDTPERRLPQLVLCAAPGYGA